MIDHHALNLKSLILKNRCALSFLKLPYYQVSQTTGPCTSMLSCSDWPRLSMAVWRRLIPIPASWKLLPRECQGPSWESSTCKICSAPLRHDLFHFTFSLKTIRFVPLNKWAGNSKLWAKSGPTVTNQQQRGLVQRYAQMCSRSRANFRALPLKMNNFQLDEFLNRNENRKGLTPCISFLVMNSSPEGWYCHKKH